MNHTTCPDQFLAPAPSGEWCLLVVHAPSESLIGKRYRLSRGELVIGREIGCDVILDAPDVSRRHARVREDSGRHLVEDLGSTNGTIVNEQRVAACTLSAGASLRLGSVILKYLDVSDLETVTLGSMRRLADEDSLTGLALRRVFSDALDREVARSRRHGHPLCLALIDLDHFKDVNDRFGHLVGDMLLRQVSSCIRALVRREQLLARVGGDELALLLPDVPLGKAEAFAEKIRCVIESSVFGNDRCWVRITVSIGIAAYRNGDLNREALIAQADEHLYAAKCAGRNRIYLGTNDISAPVSGSVAISKLRSA